MGFDGAVTVRPLPSALWLKLTCMNRWFMLNAWVLDESLIQLTLAILAASGVTTEKVCP